MRVCERGCSYALPAASKSVRLHVCACESKQRLHLHLFVITVITLYFMFVSYEAPRSVSFYCAHTYTHIPEISVCDLGSSVFSVRTIFAFEWWQHCTIGICMCATERRVCWCERHIQTATWHCTSDRDREWNYWWVRILVFYFAHAQRAVDASHMHKLRWRCMNVAHACVGAKYIIKHKCSWLNVKHGKEEEQMSRYSGARTSER